MTVIRPAMAADAPAVAALINRFAEQNLMLPRTERAVLATLADWRVARTEINPQQIVGCGSVVALTESLAEVRSLAVDESQHGKGVGGDLVRALINLARERDFTHLCALTLRESFFERLGFRVVDRWSISPKLWQECIYCPKFHRCDEVAVLMNLVKEREGDEMAAAKAGAWNSLLKWSEWQPLKLAYRQEPVVRDAAKSREERK